MRIGVRGHDITADTAWALCKKLDVLGVHEIQLVTHKSFPGFVYSEETVCDIAASFQRHGIHAAVYGCYIDPLSDEGQARFHEHIRYAQHFSHCKYRKSSWLSTNPSRILHIRRRISDP